MNRYRASAIHLGISATIATLVFAGIYLVWYPGALFGAAGGRDLLLMVLAVDVTAGPLVTLIIFVPGKKGLVFDLWVIGILQASFLTYGVWTISEARPVYVAFVKDRFELAHANQIPDSVLVQAKMNRYLDLPWLGPKFVGVRFPTDADEKFKLMISGMAGVDIHCYPQYQVPYEQVAKDVLERSIRLQNLASFNKGLSVQELAQRLGRKEDEVRYLPLRAGKVDLTVIIDAKTGAAVKIVNLKPWEYE
jgi:hypothetical protein